MRRLLLALAPAIFAAAAAAPAQMPPIAVEDWSRQPPGRAGIPEGWTGHSWGSPKYDLTVIAGGSDRVLRLRSRGDNSTIGARRRNEEARPGVDGESGRAVRVAANAHSLHVLRRPGREGLAGNYRKPPDIPEGLTLYMSEV